MIWWIAPEKKVSLYLRIWWVDRGWYWWRRLLNLYWENSLCQFFDRSRLGIVNSVLLPISLSSLNKLFLRELQNLRILTLTSGEAREIMFALHPGERLLEVLEYYSISQDDMFGLYLEQGHIEVWPRIKLPYKRKFSLSEGYNFIFFGLSLKEQRIVQSKDRSEPQGLKILFGNLLCEGPNGW